MRSLLRIFTPRDSYVASPRMNPHEGMVICRDHLEQIRYDVDPTCEELSAADVQFWHYACLMCGVEPVIGRTCENERCRGPLHPQWPAMYCSNECAMEDA